MHLNDLQKHTVETGKIVFGERNVDDQRERALRFFEEACELVRAARLPYSDACALLAHEYHDRKVGELSQEIAGAQVTLLSLAASHKIDAEEATLKELARILDKRDECRAKHDAKPAWATTAKATAA